MAEDTGLLSSNVSAGDDANASQYNNLRADTKKMRQEEFNAGATINGATLPVPVYQNTTDNEVYACDANVSTALEFIGFAISNGTDGNAIIIQHTGIVGGFTGLSEGERYYVQDTAGTIGTSKGTYEVLVGIAISETELLIIKAPTDRIFKNGVATRAGSVASGDQVIAHGLGAIPKKVKITAYYLQTATTPSISMGVFDGTLTKSMRMVDGFSSLGSSTTNILEVFYQNTSNSQKATIAVDATNITLTWILAGSMGASNIILLWEAET